MAQGYTYAYTHIYTNKSLMENLFVVCGGVVEKQQHVCAMCRRGGFRILPGDARTLCTVAV